MGRPRPIVVALALAFVATGIVVAGIVTVGAVVGPVDVGPLASSGVADADERTLVVSDAETGERLLSAPVTLETRVALEYTHSVEGSRVYEAYAVRDDHLELTHVEFESSGWGLPSGASVTHENGTFVAAMNRTTAELTVAPGEIAGHRLHVGNRTYDLVALSGARSVTIEVVPSGPDRPALAPLTTEPA